MSDPIPVTSHEAEPTTALEVVRDQPVEQHRQSFNRDQVELLKRTICAGSTDDELALFIKVAERTGLDPFARQIHAVKRWDSVKRTEVMAIQIGIDGFRLIAERTHRYAGRLGPYWCGDDGEWLMDSQGRPRPWLKPTPPAAAMVGVRHRDYAEPLYAIATWASYVQTKKDGNPMALWATKPDIMLAKCAESLALRGAFPAELSGLFTDDEMGQAPAEPPPPTKEQALGWADAAVCHAAHADVRAAVSNLPADMDRSAFDTYRVEHGWPMSPNDLDTLAKMVYRAAETDEKPTEAPEAPKRAPKVQEAAPVAPGLPLDDGLQCAAPGCEEAPTERGGFCIEHEPFES